MRCTAQQAHSMPTWNLMPLSRFGGEIGSKSGLAHRPPSTCAWILLVSSEYRKIAFASFVRRWVERSAPRRLCATRQLSRASPVRQAVQSRSCWIETRSGLHSIVTLRFSVSDLALAPTASLLQNKSSAGWIREPMPTVDQVWHRRWDMLPLGHIVSRMYGLIPIVYIRTCRPMAHFAVMEQCRRSGLQNVPWTS